MVTPPKGMCRNGPDKMQNREKRSRLVVQVKEEYTNHRAPGPPVEEWSASLGQYILFEMKAVFATSLISALLSLAAVFGFAAITIVPQPGAESFRATAMTVAGVFIVVWAAAICCRGVNLEPITEHRHRGSRGTV